jgi:hypothetical protein
MICARKGSKIIKQHIPTKLLKGYSHSEEIRMMVPINQEEKERQRD